MGQDEIWDTDAARDYDTPGTGMFAPEVLGPTVEVLARLAAGGPALEFAIGTGRVAVPMSERGVPVAGIELSGPMIERLRAKAGADTIPVVVGNMAAAVAPWPFTLVYLVFNTISHSEPGYIGLYAYDVLRQRVVSHHFRFGDGKDARLSRSPHRYIWPTELDLMAQLAGFELESRHADWSGSEFTADSRSHVSVYRL
jgi:hypothetical protein